MTRLLLKPSEAADVLGIGRSKAYALIREGAIPSIRLGKTLRVPAERLRAWIDEQEQAVGIGR